MPRQHRRGLKESSQSAGRRSSECRAGSHLLDTNQRCGPPGHAGLVQAARIATLATGKLHQVSGYAINVSPRLSAAAVRYGSAASGTVLVGNALYLRDCGGGLEGETSVPLAIPLKPA